MNDIILLFGSLESVHSFHEYVSSKHQSINFTVEQKYIGSLSILDVKIGHRVYRKLIFSGVSPIIKVSFQLT